MITAAELANPLGLVAPKPSAGAEGDDDDDDGEEDVEE